ncbi:hypothetical protein [Carnobacterium sp. 1290_CSPC]|uniref:hypothetical protein n=1 Tax=Carnobacterium sp. 1290_CSPC TaxID=1579347 RepID=UPI00066091AB|nr:hypothetical protein [Carnobacterium sp. 1290_CSPC]
MDENNLKQNLAENNRLQAQIKREKIKQRKLRTRRLIQKGALLEKYFNLENSSPDETELFLKQLKQKINDLN